MINKITTYLLFFAICIIITIIIIELILLIDNKKELIMALIYLGAGFGSRFALSFTPNVFASLQRTFIYLDFTSIIPYTNFKGNYNIFIFAALTVLPAISIFVYALNIGLLKKRFIILFSNFLCISSILPLGYFFAYVYNYGGNSIFDLFR